MALDAYDAGLLSSHGGGDVDWWQDYIRAELGRAHDFYVDQVERREETVAATLDAATAAPTPGPFVISSYEFRGFAGGHRYGEAGLYVQQIRGRMVAYFPMSQEAQERARDIAGEMRANANLLVAAQPVLAALRAAEEHLEHELEQRRFSRLPETDEYIAPLAAVVKQVNDAIAAAEGRANG